MQKLEWLTEKRKISELKLFEINPRKITETKKEKLLKSLEKFNVVDIPTINADNTIISGNQRVQILRSIGKDDEYIDVRVPNRLLEDKEMKEYSIIANAHAGEFDNDLLEAHFSDIDLGELGFDLHLDIKVEKLDAEEDNFEMPGELKDVDIVQGDVFEIGEHRLICGDSTLTDTFDKLLNGELIDMVVTDPPYNVAYEGKTKEALTIKNDSMNDDSFYKFLYDFYTACAAFTKEGGAWYVWHADMEGVNFRKAMIDAGLLFKQCLVWVKSVLVMGRQDYHWKHEPCLYGWKPGAAHNWYSDRKQTTVLNFDKPARNGEHPTMKPVELFAYQIQNSSKIGDIVCDAFGGSGTTMVACQQLKRKARLVEFDPKYCQVIIDRMRKLNPNIIIKRNGAIWL